MTSQLLAEPPSTPSKPDAINSLVADLNARCPQLRLRTRSNKETPTSRSKNSSELCFDLINRAYWHSQPGLQGCLADFKYIIAINPTADPVIVLIRLLKNLVPTPAHSKHKDPSDASHGAPGLSASKPVPTLNLNTHDDRKQDLNRPTTPKADEDEFETPPESPSRSSANRPSAARKRSSTNGSDRSPKYPKIGDLVPEPEISFTSTRASGFTKSFGSSGAIFSFDGTHDVGLRHSRSADTDLTSLATNSRPESRVDHTDPISSLPSEGWQEAEDHFRSTVMKDPRGAVTNSDLHNEVKDRLSKTGLESSKIQWQYSHFARAGLCCENAELADLMALPFFQAWELLRLAQTYDCEPSILLPVESDDFESFFECNSLRLNVEPRRIEKPTQKAWNAAANGNYKEVSFLMKFAFNKDWSTKASLMKCSLNVLKQERSCRFQRAFGASRWIFVDLPKYEKEKLPPHLRHGQEVYQNAITEWLSEPKYFLGREWHVIHVKMYTDGKRGKKDEKSLLCRAFLFATSGQGLYHDHDNIQEREMTVSDLVRWFMPLEKMAMNPFPKTAARLDLGFSGTVPTLCFTPDQVKETKDILPDGTEEYTLFDDPGFEFPISNDPELAMNDGCETISYGACVQILEHLKASGINLDYMPTAFQARINGAKGVWVRSASEETATADDRKVWICINKSQRKFARHDEDTTGSYDSNRFTFEVVNWSSQLKSHALNLAFIPILVDRGVNLEVLTKIAEDVLLEEGKEILDAIQESQTVLQWLYRHFSPIEKRKGGIQWHAGLPKKHCDRLIFLLSHGLQLAHHPSLRELFLTIVTDYFGNVISSLSIRLAESTMALGIADKSGILEPGEVFLSCSKPLLGRDGEPVNFNDGQKVLIARHPSLRASDIQAFRFRSHPSLRHIKDVLVFSSKGSVPAASKLQGGDYDGDLFWMCFDSRIVENFRNAPAPIETPDFRRFGVTKDTRSVHDVLQTGISRSESPIDYFLRESFQLWARVQLLGRATKDHERQAYATRNIRDAGVLLLADLHDVLIDWLKNGYHYSDGAYARFIAKECKIKHKKPQLQAYEEAMDAISKDRRKLLEEENFKYTKHPSDVIFFKVIVPRLKDIYKNLQRELDRPLQLDIDITGFLERELEIATPELQAEVKKLEARVESLYGSWNYDMNPLSKEKFMSPEKAKDLGSSASQGIEKIQQKYATFLGIAPSDPEIPGIAGWLRPRFKSEPSTWHLLKAALAYKVCVEKKRTTSMPFHLAGRETAYIKAVSTECFLMIDPIWRMHQPGKTLMDPVVGAGLTEPALKLLDDGAGRGEQGEGEDGDDNGSEMMDLDDFYSVCGTYYEGDDIWE